MLPLLQGHTFSVSLTAHRSHNSYGGTLSGNTTGTFVDDDMGRLNMSGLMFTQPGWVRIGSHLVNAKVKNFFKDCSHDAIVKAKNLFKECLHDTIVKAKNFFKECSYCTIVKAKNFLKECLHAVIAKANSFCKEFLHDAIAKAKNLLRNAYTMPL